MGIALKVRKVSDMAARWRGAEEAGKNLGVNVTYIYPDQLTIPNQVQKIEEAIAAKANGIALCEFAQDDAYRDVAARAKEAGIAFGSAAAPPAGALVRDPNDMFLFRTGSDEKTTQPFEPSPTVCAGSPYSAITRSQPSISLRLAAWSAA